MTKAEGMAIAYTLIRNNAIALLQEAKRAETGEIEPLQLIASVQEVANKIIHVIDGD